MNRFHLHLSVTDLDSNIRFYTALFARAPVKRRDDYAKWMLDDPRLNFAISARGHTPGINHLGVQAESEEALAELKSLAERALGNVVVEQGKTTCCYAESEKHWVVDPQGVAWEHFLTHGDAPEFGKESTTTDSACCIPIHSATGSGDHDVACCVPTEQPGGNVSCCNGA